MSPTVAIIGGGPAGAACAWRLAGAGVRTLLYEREPDREKPCGGGLTGRAFAAFPRLRELDLPWTEAHDWRMVGPGGRVVDLRLEEPVRILPRRELDGALRREAVKAGAALVCEPVRELSPRTGGGWRINDHAADVLIGAGGMHDPLARRLGLSLARAEQAAAVGRFVAGQFPPRILTQFLPESRGYIWWFPRRDHASFGIELPSPGFDAAFAKRKLAEFAAAHLPGVDVSQGEPYGWTGPAITAWDAPARRWAGPDWLLIGDAAGLCDGTTGEGISYALASGLLAAEAVLQGDPHAYDIRLRLEVVPDLAKATDFQAKLYRPRMLSLSMWMLGRSPTNRRISEDLAHGRQNYLTLRRRIYRSLPRILWESLFSPSPSVPSTPL
jgi:flavin-dependent dehydrogenase